MNAKTRNVRMERHKIWEYESCEGISNVAMVTALWFAFQYGANVRFVIKLN